MSHEQEMLYNLLSQIKTELQLVTNVIRNLNDSINHLDKSINSSNLMPKEIITKVPDYMKGVKAPFEILGANILCYSRDKKEQAEPYRFAIWCAIDFAYGDKLKSFLKSDLISEKKNERYDPFFTWKEVVKENVKTKGWFIATERSDKLEQIKKFVNEDLQGKIFYTFFEGT